MKSIIYKVAILSLLLSFSIKESNAVTIYSQTYSGLLNSELSRMDNVIPSENESEPTLPQIIILDIPENIIPGKYIWAKTRIVFHPTSNRRSSNNEEDYNPPQVS